MRLIKMLGLAAIAALAAMAFVGASSSSAAALKAESCKGGKLPQECKTASVGTKFTATTSTVKLSNAFITNTCHGTVEGEIKDAESAEGAGEADKILANVTNATFTECSFTEAKGLGFPWVMETWDSLFLASKTGRILNASVEFPKIGCKFAEDATHTVILTWANAEKSKVTLSGSMKRIGGSEFFCGNEGAISGEYQVSSVTDPGLADAGNVQIL